jgi:Uma2 family endonuclease
MATDVRKPTMTVQEWALLEGPPHFELVDGELREKPDVAVWHDLFLFRLAFFLTGYVLSRNLGEITGATTKVQISALRGRMPDLVFIPAAQTHLIGQNLFTGVPALAVEILSPSNAQTDRVAKMREYADLGIGQYWIADCPNRRIEIYALSHPNNGQRGYQLIDSVEGDVTFRPALFPGLEIPLGQVWPTAFLDRP